MKLGVTLIAKSPYNDIWHMQTPSLEKNSALDSYLKQRKYNISIDRYIQ